MKVYIVRHCDAGPHADGEDPSLTPEGKETASALATWLLVHDEIPGQIIASPMKRAVETADTIGDVLGVTVTTDDSLDPGRNVVDFLTEILQDPNAKRVMVVGHHNNLIPALAKLNGLDDSEIDPIAMGELRKLRMDRSSGEWSEISRVQPGEDLGLVDRYSHE